MQEGRSEATFRDYLGGLTSSELQLMEGIASKVADMSQRLYGRRLVPRAGLLRSLNIARYVQFLGVPNASVVLEIGPGCAYVGALLLKLGYRYVATDITQAFYVYQNHVLSALVGEDFVELATNDRSFMEIDEADDWRAMHVPWWKFVTLDPRPRLKASVVTCNHALCEMERNALAYNTQLAAMLLDGPGDRFFLLEGWGSTILQPIWHASRALTWAGFAFLHNHVGASILVRRDAPAAQHALRLPREHESDGEAAFHPPIYGNSTLPLTSKIIARQREHAEKATLGLDDFDEALRKTAGRSDLRTDDEIFRAFINYPRVVGWVKS